MELGVEYCCNNTLGAEDKTKVSIGDLDDSDAAGLQQQAHTFAVDSHGVAAALKTQAFGGELGSQDGELGGATVGSVAHNFESHEWIAERGAGQGEGIEADDDAL